jgi:hypothetical protein
MAMAARQQSQSSSAPLPPPRAARTVAGDGAETDVPLVLSLDDPLATDPEVVGGKAAALARARAAGVRTMPAAVLTTAVSRRYDSGGPVALDAELADVLERVAPDGGPLVVRSSSVVEDQATSSQAGQFETVLDVRGPERLRDAIEAVLESRRRARAEDQPIAVLVQPMAEPEIAGVAFGVDPVTGRSDHRVVVAVEGQPEPLVSGKVAGSRWVLDDRGHVVETDLNDGPHVPSSKLREVVGLGDRVSETFGGPQDIEWAVVDGQLVLFQSRPVTTEVRGFPVGPVYGPGPVAETFPEPLTRLEVDLWVPPLRKGVREALRISGAVSTREVDERDLVIVVDGRVALDLEVTGELTTRATTGLAARVRRLRSARTSPPRSTRTWPRCPTCAASRPGSWWRSSGGDGGRFGASTPTRSSWAW